MARKISASAILLELSLFCLSVNSRVADRSSYLPSGVRFDTPNAEVPTKDLRGRPSKEVEAKEFLKPEDLKFELGKEMSNQMIETMVEQAADSKEFISVFVPGQDPMKTWSELVDEYIYDKAMSNKGDGIFDKKNEIELFMTEVTSMDPMDNGNSCPDRRSKRSRKHANYADALEIMDNIQAKAQCGNPTSIVIDIYRELGFTKGLVNSFVYPSCMMVPRCRVFSGCCQTDGHACQGNGQIKKVLFLISKVNPNTMQGELTLEEKSIIVDTKCSCIPLSAIGTTILEEHIDTRFSTRSEFLSSVSDEIKPNMNRY